MLKKYFAAVPLLLFIIVNVLAGIAASGPVLIAFVYTFGLFSEPSASERVTGILIFAAIILGIVGLNFIAYKICKRQRGEPTEFPDNKKIIFRIIIVVIIFAISALSFFFLPDLWLMINDWWF